MAAIQEPDVRQAIENLAIQAVAYDRDQDYDKALLYYDKLVTLIFESSKCLSKRRSKKLRKSLQMYIERMELIKALRPSLEESNNIRQMVAVGDSSDSEIVGKKNLEQLRQDSIKLKALEKVARDDFLCPISYEIMKDPVVANDGYTYDRCNIEQWWLKSNLSPMTGLPIDSKALIPNHTLKSAIVSWSEAMDSSDEENA